MTQVRVIESQDVAPDVLLSLRELCDKAFGEPFDDEDWQHAPGGRHVIAFSGREAKAHAAVVPCKLWVDGLLHRALYVEAEATEPSLQGQGIGTLVMQEVGGLIGADGVLAALSTGSPEFCERLGGSTGKARPTSGAARTSPHAGRGRHRAAPRPRPAWHRPGGPLACRDRSGDAW